MNSTDKYARSLNLAIDGIRANLNRYGKSGAATDTAARREAIAHIMRERPVFITRWDTNGVILSYEPTARIATNI